MLVTDFNANGKLDIIVVLKSGREVHVWLNFGNGIFRNFIQVMLAYGL
jgi:hypothetical protein